MQTLDVTRLTGAVRAPLTGRVTAEETPEIACPAPKAEPSPYSAHPAFFRSWDDEQNHRRVFLGLTAAEVGELPELEGARLIGEDLECFDGENDRDSAERALELTQWHERARLAMLGGAKVD